MTIPRIFKIAECEPPIVIDQTNLNEIAAGLEAQLANENAKMTLALINETRLGGRQNFIAQALVRTIPNSVIEIKIYESQQTESIVPNLKKAGKIV